MYIVCFTALANDLSLSSKLIVLCTDVVILKGIDIHHSHGNCLCIPVYNMDLACLRRREVHSTLCSVFSSLSKHTLLPSKLEMLSLLVVLLK